MVLTPLLLQGWIPSIATFLNTPAWTMSAESASITCSFRGWRAGSGRPRVAPHLANMAGVWMLGMVPGALYIVFNPDGIAHPDRWSWGPWLQALKYTPLPHLASFVFGVLLASLDEMVARSGPPAADSRAGRLCRRILHSVAGAAGALRHCSRRPADAALRLHHSGPGRGKSAGLRAAAGGRWSLWARPATAFTCCTSIFGT